MNKKWLTLTFILIIVAGGLGFFVRGKDTSPGFVTSTMSTTTMMAGSSANYSSQGLKTFPKSVLNQTNITVLDISNNDLTGALPGEIHNLTKLEELNVSNNQMTAIPAEIGQLNHLKVLNYANNRITGLPLELGNLSQLKVLDLSGNNVSQYDLNRILPKLPNTQIKL